MYLLSSIVFRLYWFPVKVQYSSLVVSLYVYPGGPFWFGFNVLLILLYFMQVCGSGRRLECLCHTSCTHT